MGVVPPGVETRRDRCGAPPRDRRRVIAGTGGPRPCTLGRVRPFSVGGRGLSRFDEVASVNLVKWSGPARPAPTVVRSERSPLWR
jgi:hypothetical protein